MKLSNIDVKQTGTTHAINELHKVCYEYFQDTCGRIYLFTRKLLDLQTCPTGKINRK